MYRQRVFDIAERDDALAFAAACGRAHLVSVSGGRILSSYVPLLVEPGPDGAVSLVGHVARANPQWRDVDTAFDAMAIFTGDDAYVSPGFYATKAETGRVVPTWDYSIVQVSGRLVVHDDLDWVVALVARLSDHHEADRPRPWSVDDAPDGFIETTAKAIVGIELVVTSVEGAHKLSQNRSAADIDGVVAGLAAGNAREQAVAAAVQAARPPR